MSWKEFIDYINENPKRILVQLIIGMEPTYEQMNILLDDKLGSWDGSHDTWTWNRWALEEKTIYELLQIFEMLKKY